MDDSSKDVDDLAPLQEFIEQTFNKFEQRFAHLKEMTETGVKDFQTEVIGARADIEKKIEAIRENNILAAILSLRDTIDTLGQRLKAVELRLSELNPVEK